MYNGRVIQTGMCKAITWSPNYDRSAGFYQIDFSKGLNFIEGDKKIKFKELWADILEYLGTQWNKSKNNTESFFNPALPDRTISLSLKN